MVRILLLTALILTGHMARAGGLTGTFASIDGGTLSVEDWRGQPVLIVNTASQCGFTPQYEGLQQVWETYRDQGLVVLAVPSDDFKQELSSAAKVKEFCELTYGLDFPMTDITHVTGSRAHPFFQQVKAQTGFEPVWNFNKILIGRDGEVAATFGSVARPNSQKVLSAIETALN